MATVAPPQNINPDKYPKAFRDAWLRREAERAAAAAAAAVQEQRAQGETRLAQSQQQPDLFDEYDDFNGNAAAEPAEYAQAVSNESVAAAAAAAVAPAVEGGGGGGGNVVLTPEVLETLLSKASRAAVGGSAPSDAVLEQFKGNIKSATLQVSFDMNKRDAAGNVLPSDPLPVKLSAALRAAGLLDEQGGASSKSGRRISLAAGSPPLFVARVRLGSTYSTAPGPLALQAHNVSRNKRELKLARMRAGGPHYAALVMPGRQQHDVVLHSMSQVRADWLKSNWHRKPIDAVKRFQTVKSKAAGRVMLIEPTDELGRLCKDLQHTFRESHDPLVEAGPRVPLYPLEVKLVRSMVRGYNKEIAAKVDPTDPDAFTLKLVRPDRDAPVVAAAAPAAAATAAQPVLAAAATTSKASRAAARQVTSKAAVKPNAAALVAATPKTKAVAAVSAAAAKPLADFSDAHGMSRLQADEANDMTHTVIAELHVDWIKQSFFDMPAALSEEHEEAGSTDDESSSSSSDSESDHGDKSNDSSDDDDGDK